MTLQTAAATGRPARARGPMGAYGHLLAIYLIWGSTYLAVKLCLSGPAPLSPLHLQVLREGCGALLLACITAVRHGGPGRLSWREAGLCALTGILMWVGGNALATSCAPYAHSGFIVMAMGTIPLWCTLLDCVLNRARPTPRVLAALPLGLGGLVMVVAPALSGQGAIVTRHPVVVVLVLQLAAVTWALGTVLQRRLAGRLRPGWTAAIQMGVAALILGGASSAGGWSVPAHVGATQAASFAFLVIFGSVVAPASYIVVLRSFSPEMASTFAYVNPVVGVLLGWMVLGERPAALALAGMAVVLGSIALMMRRGA
ncbi:EamA family transporter [Gluconacetobacter azotocaptans]|uniref:DMT family transporter n=1 Tax=Gluconacetobacter azotocaptans TaxID=142834 RepID=UPI001958B042|nr:EamA family transporter [Gluconacetobacter azotocaptans]MBM9401616.1 EamA family transporter [Gluconacetobacter azotocaptans]